MSNVSFYYPGTSHFQHLHLTEIFFDGCRNAFGELLLR
jgi:hypothetical protein